MSTVDSYAFIAAVTVGRDLVGRARGLDGEGAEQEGVAALLAGQQLALVPEGYEASHQRLTRIRWAPVKQTLTPGESE